MEPLKLIVMEEFVSFMTLFTHEASPVQESGPDAV